MQIRENDWMKRRREILSRLSEIQEELSGLSVSGVYRKLSGKYDHLFACRMRLTYERVYLFRLLESMNGK